MLRALFKPSSRVFGSLLHPRSSSSMSAGNKLFVGNLAWTTDSGCLESAFSRFGDVVNAVVMQDSQTGRSRGFGFITFREQSHADAAIEGMNSQELDGRDIRVNYANSQGGGGGGQRQGGGGYRGGGGGGGGYHNQSYGGGHGGGWAADQPQQGSGGYGNHTQQSYGSGGGGYGGGQGGQGNWRGQPDNNYNNNTSRGW